jgi:hypothetical protein
MVIPAFAAVAPNEIINAMAVTKIEILLTFNVNLLSYGVDPVIVAWYRLEQIRCHPMATLSIISALISNKLPLVAAKSTD